jgi:L-rhamnose mutarotase
MIRIAFKMKLKPGNRDEYLKRHDSIWPEMKALLKANGISDYSIFYDAETDILFAVQKISNGAKPLSADGNPVLQKWWDHMADIMDVNADNSPVVALLDQVFHLP